MKSELVPELTLVDLLRWEALEERPKNGMNGRSRRRLARPELGIQRVIEWLDVSGAIADPYNAPRLTERGREYAWRLWDAVITRSHYECSTSKARAAEDAKHAARDRERYLASTRVAAP